MVQYLAPQLALPLAATPILEPIEARLAATTVPPSDVRKAGTLAGIHVTWFVLAVTDGAPRMASAG